MVTTNWTQSAGMAGNTDTDNIVTYAEQASASKDAAAVSAANAATYKDAAASSATNAATLASAASTSASQAASSASQAASSASAASTSKTAAELAKTNAETAETNAAASATAAASSASAAAASEAGVDADRVAAQVAASAAATSEANAATSETNSATSEANAAASESNASQQSTFASIFTSEALSHALSAGTSATNSSLSKNAAATSEANAAASAAASAYSAASIVGDVADAQSAATQALGYRDTASLHKLAAEAAATSATSTASALTGFDLDAIAATKAVTARDVFVYDTSKDSDGGAWRKRTQGTSWYNEALNTATRGSRKEFPAVAVIVAEAAKVTIYDGDDPALPMWMVANRGGGSLYFWMGFAATGEATSLTMLNGVLCVGSLDGISSSYRCGLTIVNFVSDDAVLLLEPVTPKTLGNVAARNSGKNIPANNDGRRLVNSFVNDVAMTVLPNAPIDPATGLPVPTIAVATAGGVSVIKDDGAVVDIVFTSSNVTTNIDFDADCCVWFLHGGNTSLAGNWRKYAIPASDLTGQSLTSGGLALYVSNATPSTGFNPAIYPQTNDLVSNKAMACANRLVLLAEDTVTKTNGMVAYVTSTYNTGWMNGDIKGAWLSDTDDTDLVGGERLTSGDFSSTTGWVLTSTGDNNLQVVGGQLISAAPRDGSVYRIQQTLLGVKVGQTLKVTFDVASVDAINGPRLYGNVSSFPYLPVGISTVYVTATLDDPLIGVETRQSTEWVMNSISVEVADADRSVNNKGLIVNGTVTRTPVATGADLVAYSGFSTSNYLEQPYNSGLPMLATDPIAIMGWVKQAFTATQILLDRGPELTGQKRTVALVSNKIQFTGYAANVQSNVAITSGTWTHFACVYDGAGNAKIYVNGVLDKSASVSWNNISTAPVMRIGLDTNGTLAANSSLALLRISATAPTASQIAKIYNDEKVLFQENAQATLYGASDAVTALAHDDATGLLHVGTSSGRSVFQGLRRVSNTTTAVGTAISASNNLIVEE